MKEIADFGVVAVAEDALVLEMFRVIAQLFLNVRKLGVKLVLLGRLRGLHTSI